jgi:hypothetical protein
MLVARHSGGTENQRRRHACISRPDRIQKLELSWLANLLASEITRKEARDGTCTGCMAHATDWFHIPLIEGFVEKQYEIKVRRGAAKRPRA